jgi:ABC-type polysaccharide/polyol phosphate export permease
MELGNKPVRIYEATGARLSLIGSLALAARELHSARYVIWRLFARDFVAGLRQRILGYFWILLAPLLGIASFVFMQQIGMLNPGRTEVPYPIFVYIGTSVWGLLVGALTNVAGGLIGNADLVIRTSIPKIAFAVTGLASICYGLLVNVIVLLLLMWWFGLAPSPWALLYPLAVAPILLLGVGLGLFLAVVGAVARDVTGMFTALLGLVMYLTPVVYARDFPNRILRAVTHWNPLAYLVDAPRSLFVSGRIPDPAGYFCSCLVSLAILALGVHAFYLIKDKVAERL